MQMLLVTKPMVPDRNKQHLRGQLGWLPLRVGCCAQMLLVTELMQGGDLRSRIRADSASPRRTGWYRDGRYIALGIARGLTYLHSRGVVWFDCKPNNVLLDHTGTVAKIADFGLAKVLTTTRTAGCLVRSQPLCKVLLPAMLRLQPCFWQPAASHAMVLRLYPVHSIDSMSWVAVLCRVSHAWLPVQRGTPGFMAPELLGLEEEQTQPSAMGKSIRGHCMS